MRVGRWNGLVPGTWAFDCSSLFLAGCGPLREDFALLAVAMATDKNLGNLIM